MSIYLYDITDNKLFDYNFIFKYTNYKYYKKIYENKI